MNQEDQSKAGPLRSAIAWIGAGVIYFLIWLFGRKVAIDDAPWLRGPIGGDFIGDRPYEEVAREESLELQRQVTTGGLIPDFSAMAGPEFDPDAAPASVRMFYEQTAGYRMDVWSETYFPMNIGLWLLVTTISRKVDQLNFPLKTLEAARGMESEIVHLRDSDGAVRYAGWYRRQSDSKRVIYTGFYMVESVPEESGPCVKVVFPMPGGNATVILRPRTGDRGDFELDSSGRRFGGAGFYRVRRCRDGRLRVWHTCSLKEHFRLYDDEGVLRCDHSVRFLGFPVLHLHYRIERAAIQSTSQDQHNGSAGSSSNVALSSHSR